MSGQPSQTLDRAFVGGLAWTAGAKWITQLVTWGSVLIAARLLSPSDFGLMEMAGFVSILTGVLAEFGIGSAVLQMRELDRRELSQLNTMALLFNSLAFVLSALASPWIASFFHAEQLRRLVIINSLTFFITGVQSIPQGLLQRDLDYRRLSLAEAAQAIVQAVVTVVSAFAGLGYWSILFGPMAGKATSAAMAIFWKPVPFAIPRWSEIKSPMKFGIEVALTRLVNTAYLQVDGIIVGRMLGESSLGVYRLAMSLASAPADKVAALVMRVTGPLFAKIQDDLGLVRRYFLFISDALALSIFPLVLGLTAVAPGVVTVVLGSKWHDAILPMQWLAVFMALRTMNTLMAQVLTSLRFTTFLLWTSLLSVVVMPVAMIIAARWGLGAVAAAWVLAAPITLLPPAVKLLRVVRSGWREYLGLLFPATIASSIMLVAVVGGQHAMTSQAWSVTWSLVVQIAIGGVIYAGVLWTFYRPLVMRYAEFLLRIRRGSSAILATDI
jgi:teichuronic acid exporter